jgi:hypothetical protein
VSSVSSTDTVAALAVEKESLIKVSLVCKRRSIMFDTALLASAAQQMMSSNTVDVNGKPEPARRTSRHRLRTLAFAMDGREYQAIAQNTEKPSRWGQLAREGHHVVQFNDAESNRFVAVDGLPWKFYILSQFCHPKVRPTPLPNGFSTQAHDGIVVPLKELLSRQ